jgi:hypothetical protein
MFEAGTVDIPYRTLQSEPRDCGEYDCVAASGIIAGAGFYVGRIPNFVNGFCSEMGSGRDRRTSSHARAGAVGGRRIWLYRRRLQGQRLSQIPRFRIQLYQRMHPRSLRGFHDSPERYPGQNSGHGSLPCVSILNLMQIAIPGRRYGRMRGITTCR